MTTSRTTLLPLCILATALAGTVRAAVPFSNPPELVSSGGVLEGTLA